jgi:hypothetical protein
MIRTTARTPSVLRHDPMLRELVRELVRP